ncbi:MAG TPA: RsmE family RNA methyltransferase [Phycisphaerae bacterium]|nr:RsmE family RNA methyltransferase [Phycisphaerae bacterium]
MRRFYQPCLCVGSQELQRDEAHHAANVLRLKRGDTLELFNGDGLTGDAEILEITKKTVLVNVPQGCECLRRGPLLHIAFAVPKGKRLDWLLEKATELGVASLWPVAFEYSVAGGDELGDSKLSRWEQHCISAAKQCELNFMPKLHDIMPLDDFLMNSPSAKLKIVGDCVDGTPNISEKMSKMMADNSAADICMLIGSEAGFTADERKKIADAGFKSVRLGETVLRIETAVIALAAAITAYCSVKS